MSVLYPLVPSVPGVPAVLRGPLNEVVAGAEMLFSDGTGVDEGASRQWAIYDADGEFAVEPDSFTAISFRGGYRLANYPIEQGGFETYDKVEEPIEIVVRLTKGGTLADRTDFINRLGDIRGDFEMYMVVTPEVVFRNMNVADLNIDRSQESGAGMIIADIRFQEIRQNAVAAFSKAKEPSGVSPYNNGSVQATDPPANAGDVQ